MKIIRKAKPKMTIERFAEENNLIMEIHERPEKFRRGFPQVLDKHYACFEGAEVSDRGCLCGITGNGSTEEMAIADYAQKISEEQLVIDAYKATRREISVPTLINPKEKY